MAAGAAILAAGVFLGANLVGSGCKCGAEKPVPVAPHGKVIGVAQ